MKIIILLALSVLISASVLSQNDAFADSYEIGGVDGGDCENGFVDGSWNSSTNTCTVTSDDVKTPYSGADTLTILSGATLQLTSSYKDLEIRSNDVLIVEDGASVKIKDDLKNHGTVENKEGGVITADKFINDEGATNLVNSGEITVNEFSNSGGNDTVDNFGTITVASAPDCEFTNSGVFNNYDTLNVGDDLCNKSKINNFEDGTITVGDNFINKAGVVNNQGHIFVEDEFRNDDSPQYSGTSQVFNFETGTIDTEDFVNYYGITLLDNKGLVEIRDDLINNYSDDLVVNHCDATITVSDEVNNQDIINNFGTFTFGSIDNHNGGVFNDLSCVDPNRGDGYVSMGGNNGDPENGSIAIIDGSDLVQVGDPVADKLLGIAFDQNGILYVSSGVGGQSKSNLIEVNPLTGELNNVEDIETTISYQKCYGYNPPTCYTKTVDVSTKIRDLTVQPNSNTLFGIGTTIPGSPLSYYVDPIENGLYTIAPSNGRATLVAELPDSLAYDNGECSEVDIDKWGGIAFDTTDRLLITGLVEDCGSEFKFVASIDPTDATIIEFWMVDRFFDGLGVNLDDGKIFGTTSSNSVHEIILGTLQTSFVAGDGTNPSDIDFYMQGAIPVVEVLDEGNNGSPKHQPPSFGQSPQGTYWYMHDAFCLDAGCYDIPNDYVVPFDLVELETGLHTWSITVYCNKGVQDCVHVGLSVEDYQSDVNSADWLVEIDLPTGTIGEEWELKVYDPPTDELPDGYIGDVTATTQIIQSGDTAFLFASFTVDHLAPMPEGKQFGLHAWDRDRGVTNSYQNHGILVTDKFAYPTIVAAFDEPLNIPDACINENPDNRYTCAFSAKQQLEVEKAEQTLNDIYKLNTWIRNGID